MQVVLGQLLTSSSALFGVEHLESLPAFDAIESAAKTSRSGADASRAQALSRFEPKRVGWFTQESYSVLHLGTMRGTVPERSLLTMQAHTPAGPLRTLAPVVFSDSELSQASIRFEGALDALTGPAARPVIDALVAKNPTKVTVDLGLVTLLDSTGVGAIVSLFKRIRAQGGKMSVVHAHDQPLAVLKLLKLDAVFGC